VNTAHPTAPNPARRRKRGFTILEVVMATAVMSLGISTSIIAIQQGFKFLDVARNTTLASQILQSEIERIRMMSWATVTNPSTMMGEHKVDLTTMFTTDPTLASRFTLVRNITVDAGRPANVVDIALTVHWVTYDGRAQQRSFQTKYIKNGLYDYYYTLANPAP
jgi:prepilin-type N-terminal cleavage/methylation domain-containing protein